MRYLPYLCLGTWRPTPCNFYTSGADTSCGYTLLYIRCCGLSKLLMMRVYSQTCGRTCWAYRVSAGPSWLSSFSPFSLYYLSHRSAATITNFFMSLMLYALLVLWLLRGPIIHSSVAGCSRGFLFGVWNAYGARLERCISTTVSGPPTSNVVCTCMSNQSRSLRLKACSLHPKARCLKTLNLSCHCTWPLRHHLPPNLSRHSGPLYPVTSRRSCTQDLHLSSLWQARCSVLSCVHPSPCRGARGSGCMLASRR